MESPKTKGKRGDLQNNGDELLEAREKREAQASEFYCSECRKSGMKVSSWQDFDAWLEYVDGSIGDTQLEERAKSEIAQFSKVFGKYLIIERDDQKHSDEEEEKRKRAKRANKIYKQVCADAGLTVCFFHGFLSWSDYVEGKISEAEFYEKARAEIQEMAAKAK
jgi:hypothetical protein